MDMLPKWKRDMYEKEKEGKDSVAESRSVIE